MKDLKLLKRIVTSGAIATTAAFGSFVAVVQAATFTLPIESAAKATGVDVLRDRYNLDGSGITIGFLSDTFNSAETFDTFGNLDTYETNVAKGYLPSDVKVLKDYTGPGGTDEGRALAQLIHAVAPGANLMFHTGVGSVNELAQGIEALAAAGADIIVDDIGYIPANIPGIPLDLEPSNEPLNQAINLDLFDLEPPNGPINQAINGVFNRGIAYFTDAGNDFPEDVPIYGHANNPNALTVGAVYYGNSPSYFNRAFGVVVEQGQIEPFSSQGNPGLFKPDVVAPDGLPISFNLTGNSRSDINPGFFSFFGTSASAPYTAAVAALLLQAKPTATPTEIYSVLRNTALSPVSGFDSRYGFGMIRGDKAITALGVKSVPEPSAIPALLCFGVAIALFLKRSHHKSEAIKPLPNA